MILLDFIRRTKTILKEVCFRELPAASVRFFFASSHAARRLYGEDCGLSIKAVMFWESLGYRAFFEPLFPYLRPP